MGSFLVAVQTFKKLKSSSETAIDVDAEDKEEVKKEQKVATRFGVFRYGDWWGADNVDGDTNSRFRMEFFQEHAQKEKQQ